MRIPLRRGRLLDDRDGAGAPLVALISQSLADARFHGADPVGQHLRIGPAGPFTIVGVVGDVKQLSLALTDSHAVYINATQSWFATRVMSLVVRARGDATALAPAIRQAIWSVDKDQPIVRVATLDTLLADSAAERRLTLLLFEVFAIAALVLAAAGIYAVFAGSVAERTREIGMRSALGASRSAIVGLVARQGMMLTSLGVAVGLAGAGGASQALAAMLFGVSRLEPRHIYRGHWTAGGSVSGSMLGARVASGMCRSSDHVESRIRVGPATRRPRDSVPSQTFPARINRLMFCSRAFTGK